jgi:hypothetical protein
MTRPALDRSRQSANLRPWRKGQSGNPKGRPPLPDIREALAEVLAEPVEGTISLYDLLRALPDREPPRVSWRLGFLGCQASYF